MGKGPVIMIFRMNNSSMYCSVERKAFLCAAGKNMLFWTKILFYQASQRSLTYLQKILFRKVVMTNMICRIFPFSNSHFQSYLLDRGHFWIPLSAINLYGPKWKKLHKYLYFDSNIDLLDIDLRDTLYTLYSNKILPSEKRKNYLKKFLKKWQMYRNFQRKSSFSKNLSKLK